VWLRTVKEAIRTIMPMYTTRRMMKQYVDELLRACPSPHDARRPGRLEPSADGRVVDDLDAVAVGIAEVARPRAVAVRLGPHVQPHLRDSKKRRPFVDQVGRGDDEPQVVERTGEAPAGSFADSLVERQVVAARGQVDVSRSGSHSTWNPSTST